MTSIREALRALLDRRQVPDQPDPEYSYVIYWTKQARAWERPHRQAVLQAVERLIGQADFEANLFQRRYQVDEIDADSHSGASVLALRKVLSALEQQAD